MSQFSEIIAIESVVVTNTQCALAPSSSSICFVLPKCAYRSIANKCNIQRTGNMFTAQQLYVLAFDEKYSKSLDHICLPLFSFLLSFNFVTFFCLPLGHLFLSLSLTMLFFFFYSSLLFFSAAIFVWQRKKNGKKVF